MIKKIGALLIRICNPNVPE